MKKGQSAKVKALNAHFPLKKERNINSSKLIAEQEKLLIFTGFVFAKGVATNYTKWIRSQITLMNTDDNSDRSKV